MSRKPASSTSPKPKWCGSCDYRTRHLDHGSYVVRCRDCHPLLAGKPPQPSWCGICDKRTRLYFDGRQRRRYPCRACGG